MTSEGDEKQGRPFPRFLDEWREVNGPEFTPKHYISHPDAISYVLASQWLFRPNFLTYRGAVIASDFDDELPERDKAALDGWFTHLGGDVSRVEAIGNLTTLPDVFSGVEDTEPYEEDLSQLAQSIAQCWRGLLQLRFPDREFVVEVYDDWDEPYDPKVTFYSSPPEEVPEPVPETPRAVAVQTLPPGRFAPLGDTPVSVHLDLPPSLQDDFADLANAAGPLVIDVRSVPDANALRDAIARGATRIADALAQTPATTILVTRFEQLWVKNRPVAEQLLTELPTALAAARAEGHAKHVALTDLASPTVDAALELLRNSPAVDGEPMPVFHYPPAA